MSEAVRPLDLPRRMTASDAIFWFTETALPVFRPIIAALYVLDRSPDVDRLSRGAEAAVARVPRLRQRVREAPLGLGMPEWVDDPHMDLAYHLRHMTLPAPAIARKSPGSSCASARQATSSPALKLPPRWPT